MKRVYLDNNVLSAMGKDDMPAQEASPISIISAIFDAGEVILYTSEVTMEVLNKWQGDKKPKVLWHYQRLPKVPYIERQELQGFQTYTDRRTFLAWPMIEDHPDWSTLRAMGLETHDAHHLMVAIVNGCNVFLTCDKGDFCPSRARIEQEYPQIQIMWPSEALYRL